jgi:hypothetical protein
VLWRSPPERVLRQLSSGARRAVGAELVAELRFSSRSVGPILATPWPRLTTLCVSLTAILAHQQRFCRFLRQHGGGALPAAGSGWPVASSNGTGASVGSTPASMAAAGACVLRSVTIGRDARQYEQTLPTEVFVVLAGCSALRRFSNKVRVTEEAV